MALLADIVNYCNYGPTGATGPTGRSAPTGCYFAVPQWAGGPTGYSAGTIVRQAAVPAVGSERCFVALTGGTGSTGTEPTWTTTRGGSVTDGTVIWMEATGLAGFNGDLTNTATWAQLKAASTPTVGALIQRNNGASLQICQTTGTLGAAEPAFSDTAGVRTVESGGTAVWISMGSPSNFKPWASPHARLANACATTWNPFGLISGLTNLAGGAGNGTVFVGDNHAEQQTTVMAIGPQLGGTGVAKVLCVDHTVASPGPTNLKTSAQIWLTGAASISVNPSAGNIYFYGLTFMVASAGLAGSFVCTPSNAYYSWDNCNFILNSTSSGNIIELNSTSNAGFVVLNNCSMKFGAVGQFCCLDAVCLVWQNSTLLLSGSSSPTTLFGTSAPARVASVLLEGVDMSSFTGQLNGTQQTGNLKNFTVKDCKLNTSMTLTNPTTTGEIYQLINCEIGATGTAFKSSRYNFEGTETTELSITRVGGAIDPMGNAQSRKIATSGAVNLLKPYRAEPMAVYNGVTGSVVTVNIFGTWTGPTGPSNEQVWPEIEFLGTTGYPLGVVYNATKANTLAPTGPVWPTDNSTWNGGGSTSPFTPFKMSVGLTGATGITGVTGPQWAGLIHARVRVAGPSMTFYIDPKITLS